MAKNTERKTNNTRGLALCGLFIAIYVVSAFIMIPMPSGVPITLQFFAVLMGAMLLGRGLSTASVAIYVLLGLCGLPIFSSGGGIAYVFQPTFGYLLGFLAGSALCGTVIKTKGEETSLKRLFAGAFVFLLTVELVGSAYMYVIMKYYLHSEISLTTAVLSGFLVFIPKDAIWCVVCPFIVKRLKPTLNLD